MEELIIKSANSKGLGPGWDGAPTHCFRTDKGGGEADQVGGA